MITDNKKLLLDDGSAPEDAPPSFQDAVAGSSSSSGLPVAPEQAWSTQQQPTGPLDTDDTQPPDFSLFIPDYQLLDNGDIISHDPHLNEDGQSRA